VRCLLNKLKRALSQHRREHVGEINPFDFVNAVSWHKIPTLQLAVEASLRKCSKRRTHIVAKALRRITDIRHTNEARQGNRITPRPRTGSSVVPLSARTYDVMNPISPRYPTFNPLKYIKKDHDKTNMQDIEDLEQVSIQFPRAVACFNTTSRATPLMIYAPFLHDISNIFLSHEMQIVLPTCGMLAATSSELF
jgi:hypothetical protein